jgi:DNA-binding transcriptional LysR family regulator
VRGPRRWNLPTKLTAPQPLEEELGALRIERTRGHVERTGVGERVAIAWCRGFTRIEVIDAIVHAVRRFENPNDLRMAQ